MRRLVHEVIGWPNLSAFGTNALIAELAERGDLWLAVSAYCRLYGETDACFASGPETCQHHSTSFDRSFCGCGSMHDYCETCGKAIGCPLDDPGPKEGE